MPKTLLKEYSNRHPGMLGVITRVVAYSIGLGSSMLISDVVFRDGNAATISVFILFAAVFELLWNTPATLRLEKAIQDQCMLCSPGGSPERIRSCECTDCPLYAVRPFQCWPRYRVRLFIYILCVFGIGAVGFLLTRESDALCAHHKMESRK